MIDFKLAFEFCAGLHQRLVAAISDVDAVRMRVGQLAPLAPTFRETLFCKGCFLPVFDQWANEFLQNRYGASSQIVYSALRCEGFPDLERYYPKTGLQNVLFWNASDQGQTTDRKEWKVTWGRRLS